VEDARFSQYTTVPTAFRAIACGLGGGPEAQILYYVGDGSVNKENKELRSSSTESWDGKKEAFSLPCARRCVLAHVSWLELPSRLTDFILEREGDYDHHHHHYHLLESRSDGAEMEIAPIERIAGNNAAYRIPTNNSGSNTSW
jgi:hypothetical protein